MENTPSRVNWHNFDRAKRPGMHELASLQDIAEYCTSNLELHSENKKIWQTIQKHYSYFYDHDIPVDFVSPEDNFSKYDLLIDPLHFLMSKSYLEKINNYVKNGGQIVGTYISGVIDETDLAYMNEWPKEKELQEIYGLEPLETDVLYSGQSNLINFEGKEYPVHDYCEMLINCTGKVL